MIMDHHDHKGSIEKHATRRSDLRRWNGWGDDSITTAIPPHALPFLEQRVGQGHRPIDANLQEVLQHVPKSRPPRSSPG